MAAQILSHTQLFRLLVVLCLITVAALAIGVFGTNIVGLSDDGFESGGATMSTLWTKHPDSLIGPPTRDMAMTHQNGTYYIAGTNVNRTAITLYTTDSLSRDWIYHGTVVDTSEVRYTDIADPDIIYENGNWRVYWVGDEREIEYHISKSWSESGFDAGENGTTGVTTRSGEWDSETVNDIALERTGDGQSATYTMVYTGGNGPNPNQMIGLATSENGRIFAQKQEPVLREGVSGGAPVDPELEYYNGQYYMYYNDKARGNDIWLATSPDAKDWTIQGLTLQSGPEDYDSHAPYAPTITVVNNTAVMLYNNDGDTPYNSHASVAVSDCSNDLAPC